MNGQPRTAAAGTTVAGLLTSWASTRPGWRSSATRRWCRARPGARRLLGDGDKLEIVAFVGGGSRRTGGPLVIAGQRFRSRLLIGTGKYKRSRRRAAIDASGAEIVTVAVRRLDLNAGRGLAPPRDRRQPHTLLPNTASATPPTTRCGPAAWRASWACRVGEARGARGRAHALPRRGGDVAAARILVKEGFTVLPYTWTIRSRPGSSRTPAARR